MPDKLPKRPEFSSIVRLRVLVLVCLALIVAPMTAQDIDIPFTKYVLDNGLTLIVHRDAKAPIVAVNVWYHVGSKNERPGKTGFAHLFEHLMFNGSENLNDDYFVPLEKVGATDLNGTTSNDRTNYFQNVPTPALDLALWMESDRMGHLLGAIDQAKLDEQRGVVQNEKRQGEDRPYGVTRQLLTENTYPAGHPYSWTVIGSMDDLDDADLDDVQKWFKTYYGAANAVLVVAGDVEPEDVKRRVTHYFGDIPAGPPVARQRAWIAERSGTHRQTVEDQVPQARIYKVWNIPQWGTAEAVHLDLVSDVLALGKSSRFYRRLVHRDQIATSASASVSLREIGGQFHVIATAQPGGDLAAVEAALDDELQTFLADGPTEAELERIKTQYFARFARAVERIGGFGGKSDVLARNQVYGGRPDYFKITLERVRNATTKDLLESGRRWLSDGVYILEVHPHPGYETSDVLSDRSKLPAVTKPPKLDWPDVRRTTLSNGLEVLFIERRETPIVELELLVDAGYAADQFAVPGVANFTSAMLDEGTKTRSALEISEELASLGATLSVNTALDASWVSISALKHNLDASLDVFADVILHPEFPDSEIERVRKQLIAHVAQEKSSPFSLAQRLLPKLLYGADHPYGASFTGTGDEETLKAITREDLKRFHAAWFQPAGSILIAVGDAAMGELREKLEARFAGWSGAEKPREKNIAEVENPSRSVLYLVDKPGAAQSMILGGVIATPAKHPDRLRIETMNRILGGAFTSRINMNLREDKHWSYGSRSFLADVRGQRPWLVYAAVQSDKTKESLVELDRELRDILGPRPATDDELDKVKKNAILRLPGRFETKSSLRGALSRIWMFDLSFDYWKTYADEVEAITLDDIGKVAGDVIRPDQMLWVVVGDRAQVEAGLRELDFGELNLIDTDGNPVD